MLTSHTIRDQFIDFFRQRHEHTFVPSSPVVPHGDPTLLFANAGMNQFKDVFLGTGSRPFTRAVNSQKCIRAGGKHNDLEDVGRDTYHHTFFEMLGNWSFGDYFKAEAIEWAWQLLTEVWGLDPKRLHATVFEGDPADGLERDEEAAELWKTRTSIPHDHIHLGDKEDNFWEMGDTGPCGPCSEIHYDATPDLSGRGLVNRGDHRVIEIWNLVFIQFNRDTAGKLHPLPARHVDTGMGFERITAVLQGKGSNYDTDIFTPLFEAIREVTAAPAYGGRLDDSDAGRIDTAYRVIADHIRTLTFALTDGAHCGNEGRDYVLRRILRRAVHYGCNVMGVGEPFFYKLVPTVVETMGQAFPELKQAPDRVAEELREEEEAFRRTLERGTQLFLQIASRGEKQISGEDAFTLFDTHGFPLDLTQVMASERGMGVDAEGFERHMEEARRKSRQAAAGGGAVNHLLDLVQREQPIESSFEGYDRRFRIEQEQKCELYQFTDEGAARVDSAGSGARVAIVTEITPFYAESGGQVGDRGTIDFPEGRARIEDTQQIGGSIFHIGSVETGTLTSGRMQLGMQIDIDRRAPIMAHHTVTHMMNRALREQVTATADQKGSLVDDQRTRFDYTHNAPLTADEIERVERQVNDDIAADMPVYAAVADQTEALKINGLRAVFGEKYPPRVRVVTIGVDVEQVLADPGNERWRSYSIEFCGGTHLDRTGEAECFTVLSEEGVARGIRRITAVTGEIAQRALDAAGQLERRMSEIEHAQADALTEALPQFNNALGEATLPLLTRHRLRDRLSEQQKRLKEHQKQQAKAAAGTVVERAREVAEQNGGNLIVASIDGADAQTLRTAMDVIRKKRPEAAMLLAAPGQDKVAFLAAVPEPLIGKGLKAGDWVREVARAAGGGGGGRPDMAQAGGKDPARLPDALDTARRFAEKFLTEQ